MFTLTKKFKFEAAHKLPYHDGKCGRLHGHSWECKIVVEGNNINKIGPKSGMLIDYSDISNIVKPLIENYLDHHYLNETLNLENPTSELVAEWIYNYLKPKLPILKYVVIKETCSSECKYII